MGVPADAAVQGRSSRGSAAGRRASRSLFWVIFFAVCATLGYSYLLAARRARSGCPDVGARPARAPARRLRRAGTRARAARSLHNEPMRADAYAYFDADFPAFAHRGGALYPPNLHRENTRHAFPRPSRSATATWRPTSTLTADGVLVAFHDTVLDRVTDAPGGSPQLPYARSRAGPDRWTGPDPAARRAVRGLSRRPLQHRRQVRRRGGGCWPDDRRPRRVRTGLRQLVRHPPAAPAPPAGSAPGRRRRPARPGSRSTASLPG